MITEIQEAAKEMNDQQFDSLMKSFTEVEEFVERIDYGLMADRLMDIKNGLALAYKNEKESRW